MDIDLKFIGKEKYKMESIDQNSIIQKMDQLLKKGKYYKVLKAASAVPKEQWTIDMYILVITALNNRGEFQEAKQALEEAKPLCDTADVFSEWYYLNGYLYYKQEQVPLADWYFCRSLEYDSEWEGSQTLHKNAQIYWKKGVELIQNFLEKVVWKLHSAQEEKKEQLQVCSEEQFLLLLSFPIQFRNIPGISNSIRKQIFYQCETEREKKKTQQFLQEQFAIQDFESMRSYLLEQHTCGREYEIYLDSWREKTDDFLGQMEIDQRARFETFRDFARIFQDKVKEAGFYAADLSEQMAIVRISFACGIISKEELLACLLDYLEKVVRSYHSWEKYLFSYYCGSIYFRYVSSGAKIPSALEGMEPLLEVLLELDCFDYEWGMYQLKEFCLDAEPYEKKIKIDGTLEAVKKEWEDILKNCLKKEEIRLEMQEVDVDGKTKVELTFEEISTYWYFYIASCFGKSVQMEAVHSYQSEWNWIGSIKEEKKDLVFQLQFQNGSVSEVELKDKKFMEYGIVPMKIEKREEEKQEEEIDSIKIKESDIRNYQKKKTKEQELVVLKIRLEEEQVESLNQTGELVLLMERIIEQNIVLNQFSLYYTDLLQNNLEWYETSDTIECERMLHNLRKSSIKKLNGNVLFWEESAYALDPAAGGIANLFLNGLRKAEINRMIGSSWCYAGKIIPGKEHRIQLVVVIRMDNRTALVEIETYMKRKKKKWNTSQTNYKGVWEEW